MTLPNFLGIGAMRSGTSWLHQQLLRHPQVFMSEPKELSFFNDFYDRGLDWYRRYFPPEAEARRFRAIGEITPTYMTDPRVPARIRQTLPDCRLIAVLRNPVERAWSEYTKALRNLNFRGGFEDLLRRDAAVLERGRYARQLAFFYDVFPRERILVLLFEQAVSQPAALAAELGRFLAIDPPGFNIASMQEKVNASYLPRAPGLYASAIRARQFFVRRGMGRVTVLAARLGLVGTARSLFRFRGPRSELPQMDERTRARLGELYAPEVETLERLLGRDLSDWTAPVKAGGQPSPPPPTSR